MVPRAELVEAAGKARTTADRLRARVRKAERLLADAAEQASETADAARAGMRALLERTDSLARAITDCDSAAEAAETRAAGAAQEGALLSAANLQLAQTGGRRFVKRVSAVC
jgi:hypothetical protein